MKRRKFANVWCIQLCLQFLGNKILGQFCSSPNTFVNLRSVTWKNKKRQQNIIIYTVSKFLHPQLFVMLIYEFYQTFHEISIFFLSNHRCTVYPAVYPAITTFLRGGHWTRPRTTWYHSTCFEGVFLESSNFIKRNLN